MSQKQLRFGNDVGKCEFIKFAKKYHKQVGEESASIGRLTVCAASPPLLQMLAEYCRKRKKHHVLSHVHEAPDHRT